MEALSRPPAIVWKETILLRQLFTSIAIAAALTGSARADLISNGPPDLSGATDLNASLGADDFTLASASTITRIRFWAAQESADAYAGNIEYRFCGNDGGMPGASCQAGLAGFTPTATGSDLYGLGVFMYEALVSIDLAAGSHWLVLHNGPVVQQPDLGFYWAYSNGNGGNGHAWELPGRSAWGTVSAELAFELELRVRDGGGGGTVPEPASLLLVGAALAALGVRRSPRRAS